MWFSRASGSNGDHGIDHRGAWHKAPFLWPVVMVLAHAGAAWRGDATRFAARPRLEANPGHGWIASSVMARGRA